MQILENLYRAAFHRKNTTEELSLSDLDEIDDDHETQKDNLIRDEIEVGMYAVTLAYFVTEASLQFIFGAEANADGESLLSVLNLAGKFQVARPDVMGRRISGPQS